MDHETDVDGIDAAAEAGKRLLQELPHAVAADFDAASRSIVISLSNGTFFTIPVRLVEGLVSADDQTCAEVEVSGVGLGLYWPSLDLDLSIPGLLAGVLGTRAWLDKQRAAHAGAAKSVAKSAASRVNGAKGGRPRKLTTVARPAAAAKANP